MIDPGFIHRIEMNRAIRLGCSPLYTQANKALLSLRSQKRLLSDINRGTLADAVVGSNPMFPQRPRKFDALDKENEGPKVGKDGFAADFEESSFSKHAGKIGICAMALSVYFIYSYFKGYKNKGRMEAVISDSSSIEPYEVNEVRFLTVGMSPDIYQEVVLECYAHFSSKSSGNSCDSSSDPEVTYEDFISVTRPILDKHKVKLRGGHLLDRVCRNYAYVY